MTAFVLLLFIAAGLSLIALAWLTFRKDSALLGDVARWRQCQAEILSSRIEQVRVQDSEGRFETAYKPHAVYRFSVSEHEFTGDSARLSGGCFASLSEAAQWQSDHAEGMQVPVHFNPQDPAKNALVLDVGSRTGSILTAAILAGLGLYPIFLGLPF